MKRLLLTVSVCALCGALSAQEMYDALVEPQLSDNETLGQVQQETPLPNLTVAGVPSSETSPYAIYAPSSRVTKEGKMKRSVTKGGHRGLDFGVDLDFIVQKGGAGSFGPDVTIGKRFSKSFYAGIVGGPQVPFQGGKTYGMVAADFKYFHPLANNEKLAPGGMLRIGYHGDFSDYSFVTFQIVPTFQYVASKTVDINLGIGFADYVFTGKGGGNSAAFLVKAGIGVHKPAEHQKTILRHNKTVDSGLQLSIDGIAYIPPGTISSGGGMSLALTYKWNPQLSFGIGFGYNSNPSLSLENGIVVYNTDGGIGYKEALVGNAENYSSEKLFLRGNYRFLKGNHSPLVSCDLGLQFQSKDDACGHYKDRFDADHTCSTSLLINPSIGYSLRTTSNSYVNMRIGYIYAGPISKSYTDGNYKYKAMNMTGMTISIGYTHTFRCLQRKHKNK
ncbi:MAG: hypothetical protein LUC86_08555 [Prevotellaceae bacterium]|nr:hypothetical protein [Prevotellaceae bacterium]